MVTPASYTVANLGADFEIEKEDGGVLNDRGQVAGSITQNGDWTMARAYRYENGTLKNMDTLAIANSSSRGWGINANGTMAGDLRIGDYSQGVTHAFRSDGTTMTDLGALGSVNNNSYTTAINDSGMVIGDSRYGNGYIVHAFRSNGTTMTDLGALASTNNQSRAVAINASGLVVGNSQYGNGNSVHAFRSEGTTMTDLGALGNANNTSNATAINASGLVVGSSYNGTNYHAFLSDGTTMTDLGALGNANNMSGAVAINASGLVVGSSQYGTTYHAFLFDGTTMTDLGALENVYSQSDARAINSSGQVVGKSRIAQAVEHAFIKSPGDSQITDLNTRLANAPGVELFEAIAISDSGYILARANTGWVLLKPAAAVPAPAAATLGAITANDPIAVGMPVNVSVTFSDVNTADVHTALWTWEGNGTSAGVVTEATGTAPGTVTGSATFLAAGLYNVTVTVTDSGGLSSSVSRQIVVYDPSAGFVTGGGWIMSPEGACKADERMTGRATFGFVSKYLKGANKPTGETEFRFQAGGLNFYSNNYDWLVVGGARAQYKGTGTINGRGSYQFMLTAVDGDLIAKGTPDRFRIKIWHHDDSSNTDVTDYDNQIDSSAAGSNLEGTVLGGGSINVKIR
ncbi:hypothetical protein KTQ42_12665|uniref:hypothetical protein n=1 Tax=Noviherbaspirillum sp. L7-7A TaxID=2850560 RepID=UPI001C2CA20D|nr:hypothetical protein [Noviherbaspirillum sp. L7-7A]MBV0880154.1 hypothetical protein [Noviherbaspirillum sp. L7-7A]